MIWVVHCCVAAWRPQSQQLAVFFTHQTSCVSTSVALWKWWTLHPGAASVCHTDPSCHTLVDQWCRNKEGIACGTVFRRGESSVLGKCSSTAETLCGSAWSSARTSLSCMGPKWYSRCIPRTNRGSWHQAGICGGQQKTSNKTKKANCIKLSMQNSCKQSLLYSLKLSWKISRFQLKCLECIEPRGLFKQFKNVCVQGYWFVIDHLCGSRFYILDMCEEKDTVSRGADMQ